MKKFLYRSVVINSLLLASCSNNNPADTNSNNRDTTVSYRPLYHFTTDSNWINDPNGLVYAFGKFHVFGQYNPFGEKWGHMSWAHAVSSDLFAWQQQPLAIPEIQNADSSVTMIFSGSAVVDSFNTSGFGKDGQVPMVAIYTAHHDKNGKGIGQSESLAYSLDEGKTWQQYSNNPVLDINLTDFRDPKVFWYAPEHKWVMAVVKPIEYKVQFYASADLKKWNMLSEFGPMGNVDKIWECPDLFQVPVEGTSEKKWVLSMSAGHPQKEWLSVQYFIGNFDGKTFTADKLNYPLYIDYGKDFYAGITFNNIPATDGRAIMMGWANCWRYANDIPTKGFRGMYTVPRELALRNVNGSLQVGQQPAKELYNYTQSIFDAPAIELDNAAKLLDPAKGTALDISFTLQTDALAGIHVLKSGTEQTTIAYDNSTKTFSVDRRQSGDTSFSNVFASIETLKLNAASDKIKVRILVDKSVLEIFVNNGEYVFTEQVFPKHNEGSIELFAEKGKANFSNVSVKQVKKTTH